MPRVDDETDCARASEPSGDFPRGVRAGLPVLIGYLPIAVTFGVLSAESIPFVVSLSFSSLVYAGASQFMALRLMGLGTSPLQVVFAVFVLNLRHLLMSASVARRLGKLEGALVPLIAFWVTDETFAVFMSGGKKGSPAFLLGLEVAAYASWVCGTGAGFILGSILPPLLEASMGVALYALFIALLVPSVKGSFRFGIVAGFSAAVNTLLDKGTGLSAGWSVIGAIAAAALLGAVLFPADTPGAGAAEADTPGADAPGNEAPPEPSREEGSP